MLLSVFVNISKPVQLGHPMNLSCNNTQVTIKPRKVTLNFSQFHQPTYLECMLPGPGAASSDSATATTLPRPLPALEIQLRRLPAHPRPTINQSFKMPPIQVPYREDWIVDIFTHQGHISQLGSTVSLTHSLTLSLQERLVTLKREAFTGRKGISGWV